MTNWTDEGRAALVDRDGAIEDQDRTARRRARYHLPEDGAEQIVAHLKLSNWQFVKGPPLPPHGQACKADG